MGAEENHCLRSSRAFSAWRSYRNEPPSLLATPYELTIEVLQTLESVVPPKHWVLGVSHSRTIWVFFDTSQEGHLWNMELTFLDVQAIPQEPSENLPHMLTVVLQGLRKDLNIIKINKDKNIYHISENIIN